MHNRSTIVHFLFLSHMEEMTSACKLLDNPEPYCDYGTTLTSFFLFSGHRLRYDRKRFFHEKHNDPKESELLSQSHKPLNLKGELTCKDDTTHESAPQILCKIECQLLFLKYRLQKQGLHSSQILIIGNSTA